MKNTTDKKKNFNGINKSLIFIIFVPLILIIGIIDLAISGRIKNIVYDEAKEELRNTAYLVNYLIDNMYPGDYEVIGKEEVAIVKGDKVLNGKYDILDDIKEETGYEVSIFYQNTRILSTIVDEDSNRIIGTTIRESVLEKVYNSEDGAFYSNIEVNGDDYLSYYYPIRNGSENIGMVAVLKNSEFVENRVWKEILTLFIISTIGILFVGCISYSYTKNLIKRIKMINKFLIKTTNGDFKEKIDSAVYVRNDEISETGRIAEKMQFSIKNFVELDSLTGINNRRYGDKYLADIRKRYIENGVAFSLAIMDIDYFKNINDTYGHLAGDMILKEIAAILKDEMSKKGFACRWGGEEFLLVFDKEGIKDSYYHLKTIVNDIRDKEFFYNNEKIHITVTCGIAEGSEAPIHVIVKEADDKLYKGKNNGRNRIVK